MKVLRRFIFLLLLTLVPFVNAQEEQTILLTFIPNIQFSPIYMAVETLAEDGMTVSLEYLDEPAVVNLVAAGRNQFGVVSGEQVILASANDRPIVYVYEWFQHYPIGLVYPSDMAIESAADLAGHTVGIPGRFGASYSGFVTLLESAGIGEDDLTVEEIGFAAPDIFCLGRVEAAIVYVNNEPLQIRNRAANGECGSVTDVNVLYVSNVVDLVSNGLITNQTTIENNPELVQAMVAAYDAGLQMVINNPAAAYLASAEYVEGLPLDDEFRAALEDYAAAQEEFLATNPSHQAIAASRVELSQNLFQQFDADTLIQFDVLLASIDLWDAEQLGYSDIESWENMQETLIALGQLEAPVELDSIFTNEFLPTGE